MNQSLSKYNLNPAQLRAASSKDTSVLILAGAGSGKTRVLVSRIVWFLENTNLNPTEILALTFTNKAAQEMKERLHKISSQANGVFLSTFHSFGSFFLRKHSELIGISRHFSIYDDRKSTQILETIFPDYSSKQRQDWYNRIQSFKDGSLSDIDQKQSQATIDMYNALLIKNNAVDFGDLIYLPQKHLESNKDLRISTQQRWKAILIDEYQDTNRTQEKLLMSMCGENSYITVIGDDDQTIYRFRGSDPTNIAEFAQNLPNTKTFILEQNYRSSLAILSCANSLISQNKERVSKNLFSDIHGKKPQVIQFENQDSECQYICNLLSDKNYKETAILYRNNFQRYPLEEAFRKRRIPYIILGSSSFYDQEEIKTLLAWSSFLINPYDQSSFTRICRIPAQGFGKKSLDIIFTHWQDQENISILDALYDCKDKLAGKAKKNVENFCLQFKHWSNLLEKLSLKNFFEIFLKETGLHDFYLASDQKHDTKRLDSLLGFITTLGRETLQGHEGLCTFLESISLLGEKTNTNEELVNRVSLTTIHQAKGLEFDRVIILGMDEGIFPKPPPNREEKKEYTLATRTFSCDDLEDERRLCYVAVTRAKSELLMTCCLKRWWFNGQTSSHSPSRFLDEIGSELYNLVKFNSVENKTYTRRPNSYAKYAKNLQYAIGDIILHNEYGRGTIVKAEAITGRHIVTVRFENNSVKKFLPEFANMKKISG